MFVLSWFNELPKIPADSFSEHKHTKTRQKLLMREKTCIIKLHANNLHCKKGRGVMTQFNCLYGNTVLLVVEKGEGGGAGK